MVSIAPLDGIFGIARDQDRNRVGRWKTVTAARVPPSPSQTSNATALGSRLAMISRPLVLSSSGRQANSLDLQSGMAYLIQWFAHKGRRQVLTRFQSSHSSSSLEAGIFRFEVKNTYACNAQGQGLDCWNMFCLVLRMSHCCESSSPSFSEDVVGG